jgi:hypothetical protein
LVGQAASLPPLTGVSRRRVGAPTAVLRIALRRAKRSPAAQANHRFFRYGRRAVRTSEAARKVHPITRAEFAAQGTAQAKSCQSIRGKISWVANRCKLFIEKLAQKRYAVYAGPCIASSRARGPLRGITTLVVRYFCSDRRYICRKALCHSRLRRRSGVILSSPYDL